MSLLIASCHSFQAIVQHFNIASERDWMITIKMIITELTNFVVNLYLNVLQMCVCICSKEAEFDRGMTREDAREIEARKKKSCPSARRKSTRKPWNSSVEFLGWNKNM